MLRMSIFLLFVVLLISEVWAAGQIRVVALFNGKAMVEIDGRNHLLKAGAPAKDGVQLISANAKEAVIDVDDGKKAWPSGLNLLVDGGAVPGVPSTVVSLLNDQIEIVRQGLGPV